VQPKKQFLRSAFLKAVGSSVKQRILATGPREDAQAQFFLDDAMKIKFNSSLGVLTGPARFDRRRNRSISRISRRITFPIAVKSGTPEAARRCRSASQFYLVETSPDVAFA